MRLLPKLAPYRVWVSQRSRVEFFGNVQDVGFDVLFDDFRGSMAGDFHDVEDVAGLGDKWFNATGWCCYTCKGQAEGDKLGLLSD